MGVGDTVGCGGFCDSAVGNSLLFAVYSQVHTLAIRLV
jgi:hypothetical protein